MPYIPPKYDFQGNTTSDKHPGMSGVTPSSASGQLMSFEDFYHQYTGYKINPYGLGSKIDDFFTGHTSSAKQAYENYVADYEFKKNQAAKDAENKATWAREDTQIQRATKDALAAGLNPWIVLNGGSMNSAMTSSQSASARYKSKEKMLKEDKDGKAASLLGSALKIILMAALMG